jgi:hypothetical protein
MLALLSSSSEERHGLYAAAEEREVLLGAILEDREVTLLRDR